MDSNLDRMIDAALATYSEATPLEGLEQRVMNRLRLAKPRRLVFQWRWLAAALATALLLIAIGLRTGRISSPTTPKAFARIDTPPPVVPVAPRTPLRTRARRSPALPKERTFPSPAPLSREERSLMAYVRLQTAGTLGPQLDEPLEIEPIQIQPLTDGSQ